MSGNDTPSYVEGVSNEVLCFAAVLMAVFFFAVVKGVRFLETTSLFRPSSSIHPESQAQVSEARQQMNLPADRGSGGGVNGSGSSGRRRRRLPENGQDNCPICMDRVAFAVETNCGHVFCVSCLLEYSRHSSQLLPMRCPSCRQAVTLLLADFTEAENAHRDRQAHESSINTYNHLFSRFPRSTIQMIRDAPALLRRLFQDMIRGSGLVWLMRLRFASLGLAGMAYVLSPLDLVPEAMFGVIGILDDMIIVFMLLLYLSVLYRNQLAQRSERSNIARLPLS